MSEFLISTASFLVALGVLITVHEYGHYLLARRLGVKVLRFSIGFGPALWTRRAGPDQTEYVLAAVPLGGYVKMLDEREGEVTPQEAHRAFNRQPVGRRFAIVAAGPLFNLGLAILAYWLMFVIGIPGIRPVIGHIEPGSVAEQAGVRAGEEIVAVDRTETDTWGAASLAVVDKAIDGQPIELRLRDGGVERRLRLETRGVMAEVGQRDPLVGLGLSPVRPKIDPVLEAVESGSAAEQAGLRPGDRVVAVDGQAVQEWSEVVEYVRARPEVRIRVEVERAGAPVLLDLVPARIEEGRKAIGRAGASARFSGAEPPPELLAVSRYGLIPSLGMAAVKTWDMSLLTLRMLGKMVVGQVSWENLSGPITIARYAGYSASGGFASFLAFLAIVSVSLGILNLLPIPVLDGGHLFYFLIELIKGSPLSEQAQALGQRIGALILMLLIALALYNDLTRLFR